MKSAQSVYRVSISQLERHTDKPAHERIDADFDIVEIYEVERHGRDMDQLRELIALALDAQDHDGEAGITRIQAVITALIDAQGAR